MSSNINKEYPETRSLSNFATDSISTVFSSELNVLFIDLGFGLRTCRGRIQTDASVIPYKTARQGGSKWRDTMGLDMWEKGTWSK